MKQNENKKIVTENIYYTSPLPTIEKTSKCLGWRRVDSPPKINLYDIFRIETGTVQPRTQGRT